MLLLHGAPGSEKCHEYGNRFVNDRLISLMKDIVTDYVEMYDQIQRTDAGPYKRFHRISAHAANPEDRYPGFRQTFHGLRAQQKLCS